jgi:exodeoxyribonuclease-3
MRIISWNVNGIRACVKQGFAEFFERSEADIIGVQEVRALTEEIPSAARTPPGWQAIFSAAERRGYSGVGLYSKLAPERVETMLGEPQFDVEGRFIAAHFQSDRGRFAVVNSYFPKGNGKDRDNSRVPYKLEFYGLVFEKIQRLRRQCPVLVMGDYNTAHCEIDLARPKSNVKSSGFLPEERAEIDRWLEAGWVDTFRTFHADEPEHYTWWSQRGGARERNVGWRVDYVLASPAAMKRVKQAFIWPHERGSDHCPIGVDIDL